MNDAPVAKFAKLLESGGAILFDNDPTVPVLEAAGKNGDLVVVRWCSTNPPKKYEIDSYLKVKQISGTLLDHVFLGWAPESVTDEDWKRYILSGFAMFKRAIENSK
jgi:hypothetical protein